MNFYATQISNTKATQKEEKGNAPINYFVNNINSAIEELKRRAELDTKKK